MAKKNTTKQQTIENEAPHNRYFHILPNMCDDELGPFEYRLLGHYIRVAGGGGVCRQGLRRISEITQISIDRLIEARDNLAAGGWIRVEQSRGKSDRVTIVDRMSENIARYAAPSEGDRDSDHPGQGDRDSDHSDRDSDHGDRDSDRKKNLVVEPRSENPDQKQIPDAGASGGAGADDAGAGDSDSPVPVQPHIALIDAYWSGLPGGKPATDDYPRFVRAAMRVVQDGRYTPAHVAHMMRVIYDPETEVFNYRKWHGAIIPFEDVVKLMGPYYATNELPQPIAVDLGDYDALAAGGDVVRRLLARAASGEFDNRFTPAERASMSESTVRQ